MKAKLVILGALLSSLLSAQAGLIARWELNGTTYSTGNAINADSTASVTGTPTLTPTRGGPKVTVSGTGTALKYVGDGSSNATGDLNLSTFAISLKPSASLTQFTITYSVANTAGGPTTVSWQATGGSPSPVTGTVSAGTIGTSFTTFTATFTGLTDPSLSTLTFTASFSGASGTANTGSILFDSVEVDAAPEPTNIALGVFGFGCVSVAAGRKYLRKRAPVAA